MAQPKSSNNQNIHNLIIGDSFASKSAKTYAQIKYNFLPKSIDDTKDGIVECNSSGKVSVKLQATNLQPNEMVVFEGSDSYSNNRAKGYLNGNLGRNRECILIIDKITNTVTLERLSHNISLQKHARSNINNNIGNSMSKQINPRSKTSLKNFLSERNQTSKKIK